MEVEKKIEITEKKEKFWCPLAGLNPFWVIFKIARNAYTDFNNNKREYMIRCSAVLNQLPTDIKQILTKINEKGETITPQQSFLEYFRYFKIKYEDTEIFALHFAEVINAKKSFLFEKIQRNKDDSEYCLKLFFESIEHLFNKSRYEKEDNLPFYFRPALYLFSKFPKITKFSILE